MLFILKQRKEKLENKLRQNIGSNESDAVSYSIEKLNCGKVVRYYLKKSPTVTRHIAKLLVYVLRTHYVSYL